MNDWFIWNGVNCTTYGIHVSELPALTLPQERVTFTTVPGRAGSYTVKEGDYVYEDLTFTVQCFLEDPAHIPAIGAWLRGSGTVTFANRTGGYYKAHVTNQIPFETVIKGRAHRTFSIVFQCKPFFYLDDNEPITITTSGTIITNPGFAPSEPLFQFSHVGDFTLTINGQMVNFDNIGTGSGLYMDCEHKDAYLQTVSDGVTTIRNYNNHMEGEFPVLIPGSNAISWDGNLDYIIITPNWRTL